MFAPLVLQPVTAYTLVLHRHTSEPTLPNLQQRLGNKLTKGLCLLACIFTALAPFARYSKKHVQWCYREYKRNNCHAEASAHCLFQAVEYSTAPEDLQRGFFFALGCCSMHAVQPSTCRP